MQRHDLWDFVPFLLQGIPITLTITFFAIILCVVVAVLLALARLSRFAILRWGGGFIVELFRGTSALVQLFWAFYVLPFFGINLPPLPAAILVLGLNEGSYFSEVVRSGLGSVLAGQREACVALHLPTRYRFFRVLLPQALPVMIPPFANALITMLKFSSLASLVGVHELSFRASLIRTSLASSGPVLSLSLLLYFSMAVALALGIRHFEKWAARRAGRDVQGPLLKWRRQSTVPPWALGAK